MLTLPTSPAQPLLILGDCLDVMQELPNHSIHLGVCDPPAGFGFMGKMWDSFADYEPRTPAGIAAWARLAAPSFVASCDARKARSAWERRHARRGIVCSSSETLEPWEVGFVAFLVDVWTVARPKFVPGAHVLAWGIPKTSDLLALSMRLAGLEVRDRITHLFGSGMPHGLDVGKAIDKMHGAEREVIGSRRAHDIRGGNFANADALERRTVVEYTAPATDDARRWDGWNTQLAPAVEDWFVARVPLSEASVAANVLRHGTGGLHIDACRVPRGDGVLSWSAPRQMGYRGGTTADATYRSEGYPSNVILSHDPACTDTRCARGCPVRVIDEQSGERTSGSGAVRRATAKGHRGAVYGPTSQPAGTPQTTHGDSGGASRYFNTLHPASIVYQAKAKRRDVPGPRATVVKHPTHKHKGLMVHLCGLAAAKTKQIENGAIVLDMFMGTGATLLGCLAHGQRFIGIEKDPHSFAEAQARAAAAIGDPEAAVEARAKAEVGEQTCLF